MPWWGILIIIIGAALLGVLIWALTLSSRKINKEATQTQTSYDKYDKLLQNLSVTGYCFVSEQFLQQNYSSEQLQQNKYLTRPFVCFQTPAMKTKQTAILLSEQTRHNDRIYPDNLYIDNGKFLLNSKTIFLINTTNLKFKAKEWHAHNGHLQEISRRIDDATKLIKQALIKKNVLLD